MSRPQRRLDLEGDLALEVAGEPLALRAAGSRADLEVGGVGGAWRVLRALPERGVRRGALRGLDAALRNAGLTLAVRIANREVGHLGDGARPGTLSRVLGLDPVALRVGPLWRAWRDGGSP